MEDGATASMCWALALGANLDAEAVQQRVRFVDALWGELDWRNRRKAKGFAYPQGVEKHESFGVALRTAQVSPLVSA